MIFLSLSDNEHFVCWDLEWDIDTKVIVAVSFVGSDGFTEVDLIEEFSHYRSPEKAMIQRIISILSQYEYNFGWYSKGFERFDKKKQRNTGHDSDLKVLHERSVANNIESIVEFYHGSPGIINPRHDRRVSYDIRSTKKGREHIDAQAIYKKALVENNIFHKKYRTYSLDAVAKAVIGRGKFKGFKGTDFNKLSITGKKSYVIEDSQLVYDLLAHDNFKVLKMMQTISKLTGTRFSHCCNYGVSSIWKSVIKPATIDKYGHDYLSILANDKCRVEQWRGNRGSEPPKPVTGEYTNVGLLDVTSLYPSIIIYYNLSFDTINRCECCRDNPEAQFRKRVYR